MVPKKPDKRQVHSMANEEGGPVAAHDEDGRVAGGFPSATAAAATATATAATSAAAATTTAPLGRT